MFPTDLTDKNGAALAIDDVIYNSKDYYTIYWNNRQNHAKAISCTNGYMNNITQKTLEAFERIGRFEDHERLFRCD
jgi:hypothetical protein